MTETFDPMVERIAHRRCTQYRHNAGQGEPMYLFTAAHLLDFARELRDELTKGQEPVARLEPLGDKWLLVDKTLSHGDYKQGLDLYTRPTVAAPAGVPDGWKLVPKEPTREMLDAAHSNFRKDVEIDPLLKTSYRAMLSAAPDHISQPVKMVVPEVTDGMAIAFHNALTDGAIGSDEVNEIKAGLRAALYAAPAAPADAVAKDAERYRWLRTPQAGRETWVTTAREGWPAVLLEGDRLDSAIDTAMQGEKK